MIEPVPVQNTPRATNISPPRIDLWRWGVVWLMFLATMLNYMDRQTLGSSSNFIMAEFDLDESQYGWIEFWFGISYGIFQFPAGFLADRWNLRRLYAAALLVWSAAGFMMGLSQTVLMLSACRFVLGVGEAFNWPCATAIVRRVIPQESRSLANGIFHSGASMGAVLTPLLVLAVAGKTGENWRLVFQIVGALGLLWAVLWYWCLRGARGREVAHPPPEDAATNLDHPGFGGAVRSFVGLMNLRIFWITFTVSMAVNLCWHSYRIWLPRFMHRDLHLDPDEMQWALAGFFIAADIGSLATGYVTRRLVRAGRTVESSRKIVLIGASLLCLLSTPAALVMEPWISLPLIFLVAAGSLGCFPILLALVQEISARQTAACMGFFGTTAWLVIAASSPAVGQIVDNSGTFGPSLIVVGFVPLIGAIAALWWPEPA